MPSLDVAAGVVGLLLLAAPLALPATGVDDPTYAYERFEVTVGNESVYAPGHGDDLVADDDVACLDADPAGASRACALERHVLAAGELRVEGLGRSTRAGYEAVLVDGRFYEPTSRAVGEDVLLGLSPLPAGEALTRAATRAAEAPGPVGRALRDGEARSHRAVARLHVSALYRHDGTAYAVYRSRVAGPTVEPGTLELLSWLAALVGLLGLVRATRSVDVVVRRRST